ncbi:glutathione S-transferase family protein [Rhodopseudomonas palustris]|uniref:Glutathione S-transferase family protein n=1 Tax=Rhodopseudomonas palustris TaxID=1076 RepID=A0A418UWY9_RHOPL|nr:glutathione S-transferase family protein [Rhodopseudomonas palustris]RJF64226.1 glutathione S-transferase family protein [Rhodopseudomonas palustris]
MKLSFSPASPFARKVRIAAIELGLIDQIDFMAAATTPGQPNEDYIRQVNPLKKLPALILDSGEVIIDSFVIVEYLDDLAGGGKLTPSSGPERWRVRSDHSLLQGMMESMLLCRYEKLVRPKDFFWQAWYDDHWHRAWTGFAKFDANDKVLDGPFDIVQIALTCALGYADFRFAECGWRDAYPKLAAFNERMMQRESVKISMPPPA